MTDAQRIMDEFEGLKWGPVKPHHLDYQNAEVLFIGEKHFPDSGGYQETGDELAQLEDEDEKRVKHLDGECTPFDGSFLRVTSDDGRWQAPRVYSRVSS